MRRTGHKPPWRADRGRARGGRRAGGRIWFVERGDVYETGKGEQKRIALADGSWLILDTETRLRVRLGRERRAIALEHGRAYFDVASDVLRPFVVNAGNRDVVVTGTAFDVQRANENVSVTLERGHVFVRACIRRERAYLFAGTWRSHRLCAKRAAAPRPPRSDAHHGLAHRDGWALTAKPSPPLLQK